MNENRVFELRVYTANEGKLEALKTRFLDHTTALFNKHRMEVIGYWSPQDPDKAKDMFYILPHPSRADAEKNWNAFKFDADWISVKAASDKNGAFRRIFRRITGLAPGDYRKRFRVSDEARAPAQASVVRPATVKQSPTPWSVTPES